MDTDTFFRYLNTAFNVLELLIVVWIVRDRRIIMKNFTRLAETVYQLSKLPEKLTIPPTEASQTTPQTTETESK